MDPFVLTMKVGRRTCVVIEMSSRRVVSACCVKGFGWTAFNVVQPNMKEINIKSFFRIIELPDL